VKGPRTLSWRGGRRGEEGGSRRGSARAGQFVVRGWEAANPPRGSAVALTSHPHTTAFDSPPTQFRYHSEFGAPQLCIPIYGVSSGACVLSLSLVFQVMGGVRIELYCSSLKRISLKETVGCWVVTYPWFCILHLSTKNLQLSLSQSPLHWV
jgi:hypothetical protein